MYSKSISLAFVLAATLASSGAVVFPRGNNEHLNARDPPSIPPTVIPTTTPTPTTTPPSSTTPPPTTTFTHPTITPTTTPTPTTTLTPTTTPTPTTTLTPTTTQTPTTTLTPKPPFTTYTPTTTLTPKPPFTTYTPTPTVTPTVRPTHTGKPSGHPSYPSTSSVSCNGVQPWQVNLAYSAGAQVIFNNQLWTATQWSYNNNPESVADEWTLDGVCDQPISNKVDCTGIPAWNQSTAYPGGSKVIFNGHLWISTQWTESNKPGDASGTWKDLGACN